MNRCFGAAVIIAALCLPAHAQTYVFPKAVDDFVAICLFEIYSDACDMPMNDKHRKALALERAEIKPESDGEETTALVKCALFRDQFMAFGPRACTRELREKFYEVLDNAARKQESAPK